MRPHGPLSCAPLETYTRTLSSLRTAASPPEVSVRNTSPSFMPPPFRLSLWAPKTKCLFAIPGVGSPWLIAARRWSEKSARLKGGGATCAPSHSAARKATIGSFGTHNKEGMGLCVGRIGHYLYTRRAQNHSSLRPTSKTTCMCMYSNENRLIFLIQPFLVLSRT